MTFNTSFLSAPQSTTHLGYTHLGYTHLGYNIDCRREFRAKLQHVYNASCRKNVIWTPQRDLRSTIMQRVHFNAVKATLVASQFMDTDTDSDSDSDSDECGLMRTDSVKSEYANKNCLSTLRYMDIDILSDAVDELITTMQNLDYNSLIRKRKCTDIGDIENPKNAKRQKRSGKSPKRPKRVSGF